MKSTPEQEASRFFKIVSLLRGAARSGLPLDEWLEEVWCMYVNTERQFIRNGCEAVLAEFDPEYTTIRGLVG